ncbi:MAG TPA: FAD:protein FMN transferase [Pseudolabrys sp.]|nr:FAD:protein FMN transferase [Pseudolabrys sp.]
MPTSCDSVRRAQPLFGTFVEIAVDAPAGAKTDAAIDAAFSTVIETHRLMSFHEPDSDVSRLNREASRRDVEVAPWTYDVIAAALDLYHRSSGVFDIAIAPVLQTLGLLPPADAGEAEDTGATSAAILLLPGNRVRFQHPALRIDLGGIAKGFAVDRAMHALHRHGVTSGLVNAGGDLAAFGADGHSVGIRDPRTPDRLLCAVMLHDQALASSASRAGTHGYTQAAVIDPIRRLPTGALGATVLARSCMHADALTKIVMLAGERAAPILDHFGASALLITANGEVTSNADWQNVVSSAA